MTTPLNNPQPTQPEKPVSSIRGEPLPLDDLLDFATIDLADIESAAQWFDDNATEDWIGALDSEPLDDNPNS
jgi:hypothetical protein